MTRPRRRHRRRYEKVRDGLSAYPTDTLDVAETCDTKCDGGEHERNHDHEEQAQEDLPYRPREIVVHPFNQWVFATKCLVGGDAEDRAYQEGKEDLRVKLHPLAGTAD
jgi:hypothetical protein